MYKRQGLAEGEASALDHFTLRLAPGDCVLMVSDGICGSGDDGWLRERLKQFDGASPKDLARDLITHSPQNATDDRTALVAVSYTHLSLPPSQAAQPPTATESRAWQCAPPRTGWFIC